MIYKFRIISSENDDFIREVAIDSQSTFLDLNNFILEELGYEKNQVTSFFITDRNWQKEIEITLLDMTEGQDSEIKVMDKTKLGELITEKKQRLLFVFDQFAERALFLELFALEDKVIGKPVCTRREGEPPPQYDKNAIKKLGLNDFDPDELLNNDDSDAFDNGEDYLNPFDEEDWY
jgi:hypothetical protein